MERRPRRRRVGWAVRLGLVIAVLLWLGISAGSGLAPQDESRADIGTGGRDDREDPPPAVAAPAVEPAPLPDAALATDVEPTTIDPAVADRLWGCLRAMAAGDPDRAFASAEFAATLALGPAQRDRLDRALAQLERRARDEVGRALADARQGRVLAGVDDLRPWFHAERDEVRTIVGEAFAAESLPTPRLGPAIEMEDPVGWARGTPVRVRHDGALVVAEALDVRADEITVSIAGAVGRTFPTVARTSVEPTGDDSGHALSQAVAALRAGERLLGAAWLVRARACGAEPDRIAELGGLMAR